MIFLLRQSVHVLTQIDTLCTHSIRVTRIPLRGWNPTIKKTHNVKVPSHRTTGRLELLIPDYKHTHMIHICNDTKILEVFIIIIPKQEGNQLGSPLIYIGQHISSIFLFNYKWPVLDCLGVGVVVLLNCSSAYLFLYTNRTLYYLEECLVPYIIPYYIPMDSKFWCYEFIFLCLTEQPFLEFTSKAYSPPVFEPLLPAHLEYDCLN